ncbi:MAG: hypothetical protein QF858_03615 [Candidatus Pacebacteria bacterium]|jgi:hypothetical protein|nr:hypothetical protein [bacterium]MDP6527937.1 hypothetical protein [Candidatus Paceibacterota bacterium]MDP6659469.1 hypothetical protein [Candidatus Paceibacterota bacterium]|tara:strand:- start:1197 stop:1805 length:609 start_codon:yes stop_codon:yes gene_type:complete
MESTIFLNIEYLLLFLYYLILNQEVNLTLIPGDFFVLWDIFRIVSTVVSLLLFTSIVYVLVRAWQLKKTEEEAFETIAIQASEEEGTSKESVPGSVDVGGKWEDILAHIGSENPNDWRLAIIEADVLLEQILTRAGYEGETLGEQLKSVARGDFESIDSAWEAHKVRNRIAHEGTRYDITHDEAKQTINLYRRVFKDLQYIN